MPGSRHAVDYSHVRGKRQGLRTNFPKDKIRILVTDLMYREGYHTLVPLLNKVVFSLKSIISHQC